MARRSKSNHPIKKRQVMARRDNIPHIANRSRLHRLDEIQDLRVYPHNSVYTPLLDLSGARVPVRRRVTPNFQVISEIPRNALICARRKIRKEVLFASGRGGTRVSKPKFNRNSNLRCK